MFDNTQAPPALYAGPGPGPGQFAEKTWLWDIKSCSQRATSSLGGNKRVSKQVNMHLVCNLKILNKSLND